SASTSGREGVLKNLRIAIDTLLLLADRKKININQIGIGVPGTVDIIKGKIVGIPPNLPFLADFALRKYLQKYFEYPVFIDNDANVMTLAEHKFGSAKGYKNCICITLGTGIGSGIILDGKLFRGSSFVGPEFGHISICHHGIKCNCGNYGCLEMYASEPAMLKRARELLKNNHRSILHKLVEGDLNRLKAVDLFFAEELKDKVARSIIQETAYYLGAGLSSAVNLFNPEVIVIGGGVAIASGRNFIKMIKTEICKRAFTSATKNLKIVKAKLGNDAGFIGASILGEEFVEI
ncbi:MAG: ROK family protein, partial [candidate division Zixibacteria bacterium]|nr:ROK family protein [candidate division Zixibacteria bacterium]